jgi:hypothetical protein
MASLREKLEENAARVTGRFQPRHHITGEDCRKVLALIAAAKQLPYCYADPECQICQDALKRVNAALAVMEE